MIFFISYNIIIQMSTLYDTLKMDMDTLSDKETKEVLGRKYNLAKKILFVTYGSLKEVTVKTGITFNKSGLNRKELAESVFHMYEIIKNNDDFKKKLGQIYKTEKRLQGIDVNAIQPLQTLINNIESKITPSTMLPSSGDESDINMEDLLARVSKPTIPKIEEVAQAPKQEAPNQEAPLKTVLTKKSSTIPNKPQTAKPIKDIKVKISSVKTQINKYIKDPSTITKKVVEQVTTEITDITKKINEPRYDLTEHEETLLGNLVVELSNLQDELHNAKKNFINELKPLQDDLNKIRTQKKPIHELNRETVNLIAIRSGETADVVNNYLRDNKIDKINNKASSTIKHIIDMIKLDKMPNDETVNKPIYKADVKKTYSFDKPDEIRSRLENTLKKTYSFDKPDEIRSRLENTLKKATFSEHDAIKGSKGEDAIKKTYTDPGTVYHGKTKNTANVRVEDPTKLTWEVKDNSKAPLPLRVNTKPPVTKDDDIIDIDTDTAMNRQTVEDTTMNIHTFEEYFYSLKNMNPGLNNAYFLAEQLKLPINEIKKAYDNIKSNYNNENNINKVSPYELEHLFNDINTYTEYNRRKKIFGKKTTEVHMIGYNFMGPGTDFNRLFSVSKGVPINRTDYLSLMHDIDYVFGNTNYRREADDQMIKGLLQIKTGSLIKIDDAIDILRGDSDKVAFNVLNRVINSLGSDNKFSMSENLNRVTTDFSNKFVMGGLATFGGGMISGFTTDFMRVLGLSKLNNIYPSPSQKIELKRLKMMYTYWLEQKGYTYPPDKIERIETEPKLSDNEEITLKNEFYTDYKKLAEDIDINVQEEIKIPVDDMKDFDKDFDKDYNEDTNDTSKDEEIFKFIDSLIDRFGIDELYRLKPAYNQALLDRYMKHYLANKAQDPQVNPSPDAIPKTAIASVAKTGNSALPQDIQLRSVVQRTDDDLGYGANVPLNPPDTVNKVNQDISNDDEELLVLENFKLEHDDNYINRFNTLDGLSKLNNDLRFDTSAVTLPSNGGFGSMSGYYVDEYVKPMTAKEAQRHINKTVTMENIVGIANLPEDELIALNEMTYNPFVDQVKVDLNTQPTDTVIFTNDKAKDGFMKNQVSANYKLNKNYHKSTDNLRRPNRHVKTRIY